RFVLVVEADVADRHAGELDGLELRDGCERTRLADVHLDGLHRGRRLARRELEGDRPAGMMRRGAEAPLLLERIDLHHHAVRVVAEPVARRLEARAVRDPGVAVPAAHRAWIRPESRPTDPLH